MANRKKEDLKIFTHLSDLDKALNNDFGGDVLILSQKEDLHILENHININKNYTFWETKDIFLEDFNDKLLESFGLILIFSGDKSIIHLCNKIKNLDISLLCICKTLDDMEFLRFKPYSIFVCEEYIQKNHLILKNIILDSEKLLSYVDEITFENCNTYKKLLSKNLYNLPYDNLVHKLFSDFSSFSPTQLFHSFSNFKEEFEMIILVNIWLNFAINNFVKLDLISQTNQLFLQTNYNILKNNLDLYFFQNKNQLVNFSQKYNKSFILDFLLNLSKTYLFKQS
ncbi:MAG: hypothetical protein IJW82_04530 [Clostridia bacterium]|nr:hypothetical protein [Clostridia bacterium]